MSEQQPTPDPGGEGTGRAADLPAEGEVERIALHRTIAVIRPDSIAVKPSRAGLIGPAIQALLALAATWALITYLAVWPLWLLVILLGFALIAGPTAVLGLVYNVMGSSVMMERHKQSVRWQQGFLGLGIGTHELVPFWRINRFEVAGDFEDELGSGDLQDVVHWEVRLVKDNDRVLQVGSIAAARPLAEEAMERANVVARAAGEMSGAEVVEASLPDWFFEDDDDLDEFEDEFDDEFDEALEDELDEDFENNVEDLGESTEESAYDRRPHERS